MPSPGSGFCLGLRMDSNDNPAHTTVSSLPLASAHTGIWQQGHATIPLNSKTRQKLKLDNRPPLVVNTSVSPSEVTGSDIMDNQSHASLVMEAGPVIKMGLGALANRKGKGEVTTWKDVSPTNDARPPTGLPPSDLTSKLSQSPPKSGNRSPVKAKSGKGQIANTAKHSPKKQNSATKSPRLVRRHSGRSANSSAVGVSKDKDSSSSVSSNDAGSPKRNKACKVKSLPTVQLDKQRLVGQYRISVDNFAEGVLNGGKMIQQTNMMVHTDKDRDSQQARPESGYFSSDVHTDVHSESHEGMEESASEGEIVGTIKLRPKPKPNKNLKKDCDYKLSEETTDKHSDGYNKELTYNENTNTTNTRFDHKQHEPNPHTKIDAQSPQLRHRVHENSNKGSPGGAPAYSTFPRTEPGHRASTSSWRSLTESGEKSQDDYFFDEDFGLPGDGRLASSVGLTLQGSCAFNMVDSLGAQGDMKDSLCGGQAILPHSINGSYTAFGALRDSFLQNEDLYSGPCESEVSATGSRTSMEVSSSEREMMCSSDMLDYPGSAPLFTPPVCHSQEGVLGHSATDSLSRQLEGEVTASTSLSRSSAEITLRCGKPHKDAYFLSFSGSQGKVSTSESESSYVSSTHEGKPNNRAFRSLSSAADDAEDEQSSSFQFANIQQGATSEGTEGHVEGHVKLRTWNMKGSRYPGRICLEALQEYLSQSSGTNKSLSQSVGKLSPICAALLSSGELEKHCAPKQPNSSFLKRSGRMTTWKQIRTLRSLGKKETGADRSKSMPELTTNRWMRGFSEETSESEDDHTLSQHSGDTAAATQGFHNKRHSAYVLDLYQRLQSDSNPPSPDTLAKIDQILLKEGFGGLDAIKPSSGCCHSTDTSCDSACSSGHYPFYNMCVQRSDILAKTAQLRQDLEARDKLTLDLTTQDQPVTGVSGCTQTLRGLRLLSSKETAVSPGTVNLWQGTRNFSAQFPPKTSDFGLQTSLEVPPGLDLMHAAQQTSPYTPERDLFSLLEEVCARAGGPEGGQTSPPGLPSNQFPLTSDMKQVYEAQHLPTSSPSHTERWARVDSLPHKGQGQHMSRAASECSQLARVKSVELTRGMSLSPSRVGMTSYYNHRSLPDLDFLNRDRKSSLAKSEGKEEDEARTSLFDPVKIPIILSPMVDSSCSRCSHSTPRSHSSPRLYSSPKSTHPCCNSSPHPHSSPRSHSSPRLHSAAQTHCSPRSHQSPRSQSSPRLHPSSCNHSSPRTSPCHANPGSSHSSPRSSSCPRSLNNTCCQHNNYPPPPPSRPCPSPPNKSSPVNTARKSKSFNNSPQHSPNIGQPKYPSQQTINESTLSRRLNYGRKTTTRDSPTTTKPRTVSQSPVCSRLRKGQQGLDLPQESPKRFGMPNQANVKTSPQRSISQPSSASSRGSTPVSASKKSGIPTRSSSTGSSASEKQTSSECSSKNSSRGGSPTKEATPATPQSTTPQSTKNKPVRKGKIPVLVKPVNRLKKSPVSPEKAALQKEQVREKEQYESSEKDQKAHSERDQTHDHTQMENIHVICEETEGTSEDSCYTDGSRQCDNNQCNACCDQGQCHPEDDLHDLLGTTPLCCECDACLGDSDATPIPTVIDGRDCSDLSPDLERILFQPPHLDTGDVDLNLADHEDLTHINVELRNPPSITKASFPSGNMGVSASGKAMMVKKNQEGSRQSSPSDDDKYFDAPRSGSSEKLSALAMRDQHRPSAPSAEESPRRWSTGCNLNSFNFEELYNVEESGISGQSSSVSPQSSYEDFVPAYSSSCGDQAHFDWADRENYRGPMDHDLADFEHELMMRYHQWLQERKPLKSCLRKTASGHSLEAPSKPPRRAPSTRHSIACDKLMQPKLLDNPDHLPPVRRRKQKNTPRASPTPPPTRASQVTSSGSSTDDSTRLKRVSFASEVSFSSPSTPRKADAPRDSVEVKGQDSQRREVQSIEMKDDMLTLHIVEEGQAPPTKAPIAPQPSATCDPMTPTSTEVSATDTDTDPGMSLMESTNLMLLRGIGQAADSLLQHFAQAKDPFEKLRLGSSCDSPSLAALVFCELCPAVERVVAHGLRDHDLQGVKLFGKVRLTPWRLAEMTAELGPYTRPLHELACSLRKKHTLPSARHKFYGFVAGLLNLRLLDFWLGYLRCKDQLMPRVYHDHACMRASLHGSLDASFTRLLRELQPLGVLPFQVEVTTIPGLVMGDSVLVSSSMDDLTRLTNAQLPSSSSRQDLSDAKRDSLDAVVSAGVSTQARRNGSWKWLRNPGSFSNALAHVAAKISSSRNSLSGSDVSLEENDETKLNVEEVVEEQDSTIEQEEEQVEDQDEKCIQDEVEFEDKRVVEPAPASQVSLPAVVRDHHRGERREERPPRIKSDLSDLFLQEDSPSPESPLPVMPPSLPQQNYMDSYHERLNKYDPPHKPVVEDQAASLPNHKAVEEALAKAVECAQASGSGRKAGTEEKAVASSVPTKAAPQPATAHKKSRSAFSILSFFDRMLLPKVKADEAAKVKVDEAAEKEKAKEDKSKASEDVKEAKANKGKVGAVSKKAKDTSAKDHHKIQNHLNETKEETESLGAGVKDKREMKTTPKKSPATKRPQVLDNAIKANTLEAARQGVTMRERSISERPACKVITTSSIRNSSAEMFPQARPVSAFIDRGEFDEEYMCDTTPFARPMSMCDLPHFTVAMDTDVPEVEPRVNLYTDPLPRRPSPMAPYHNPMFISSTEDFHMLDAARGHQDKAGAGRLGVALRGGLREVDTVGQPGTSDGDKKVEVESADTSLTDSDSSGRGQVSHDLGEACQWDPRTDESFTHPEFKYVIAMEDCNPAPDSDKLSFEKGDYLQVLAQLDGQWLYCTSGRQEGLLPLTSVRPLTDHEVFETLNDNFYH